MDKKAEDLTTSEYLSEMLTLFGPEGEHWCKGALQRDGAYCLLGGFYKIGTGKSSGDLRKDMHSKHAALVNACLPEVGSPKHGSGIVQFNNADTTTFKDIKRVLCGAIKEALEQEETCKATS